MKKANLLGLIVIGLWLLASILVWLSPSQEVSLDERRTLAQFPELSISSLASGNFMELFDSYSRDQFPARFKFRQLKAQVHTKILRHRENNGIYIKNGQAAALDDKLNINALDQSIGKIKQIKDSYLDNDNRAFLALIPDKNYYLAGNDYPSLDYDELYNYMESRSELSFIDLRESLTIDDYYKGDIHWRQEKLLNLVQELSRTMGIERDISLDYMEKDTGAILDGVYHGQSALGVEGDRLIYLDREELSKIEVYNLEQDEYKPVYNLEKLDSRDPYDIFLSGPAALLMANNPEANSDRKLIVFRDSFGSSLVPLLMEAYQETSLIDLRYINPQLLGNYVDFSNSDVLFLLSTRIVNTSGIFK